MINRVENDRMRMTEAWPDIVMPFKQVVAVAMRRVREGTIDNLNRQSVTLRYDGTTSHRLYQLSDISVEKRGFLRKRIASRGPLVSGLFIEGIQRDKAGYSLEELVPIQIPRDVSLTTRGTLFLQRGSMPEDVKQLAFELSVAKKVDELQYRRAVQELRDKRN